MKSLADYTIVVRPDDNGSFVAYVPAIPGCHAIGLTYDEARGELANVFDMISEEHGELGQSLPQDVELMVSHAR
jgi:predicted RNase H-like HicB family nuclease